jgi:predicted metal-dependent HD superfamily phosphohydrolase
MTHTGGAAATVDARSPASAVVASLWDATWEVLQLPAPADLLDALVKCYSEPHRAYHTLSHIEDCITKARSIRDQVSDAGAVELALWYHDAVYDPRAADNEARSAEVAARHLVMLPGAQVERVMQMIAATRHPSQPDDADARFVVDIDLSILGAMPDAFDAYEQAIRAEYAWVPAVVYERERGKLLQALLDQPRLYLTDHFAARLEAPARSNLARSIARLRQHP